MSITTKSAALPPAECRRALQDMSDVIIDICPGCEGDGGGGTSPRHFDQVTGNAWGDWVKCVMRCGRGRDPDRAGNRRGNGRGGGRVACELARDAGQFATIVKIVLCEASCDEALFHGLEHISQRSSVQRLRSLSGTEP